MEKKLASLLTANSLNVQGRSAMTRERFSTTKEKSSAVSRHYHSKWKRVPRRPRKRHLRLWKRQLKAWKRQLRSCHHFLSSKDSRSTNQARSLTPTGTLSVSSLKATPRNSPRP